MRRFTILAALLCFMTGGTSIAQVVDSVDVQIIPYKYGYFEFPYDNCGAGVYAIWPDVGGFGAPAGYGNYSVIAEGDPEDGFYVPTLGQTGTREILNIFVPGGHYGLWSMGTGSQGGPTVYESCPTYVSYYESVVAGARVPGPFQISKWYAVWTVPNGVPVADFDWVRTEGLSVAFDGSFDKSFESEEGEKIPVTSYLWDMGDETMRGGPAFTHSYAEPGTYGVTLTVTDDDGDTKSITKQVSVKGLVLEYEEEIVQQSVEVGDTFTVIGKIRNVGTINAAEVRVRPLFGFIPDFIESDALLSDDGTRSAPIENTSEQIFTNIAPGGQVTVTQIYTVLTGATRDCDSSVETCDTDKIPVTVEWEATLAFVSGVDDNGTSAALRDKCIEGVTCSNSVRVLPRKHNLIVNVTSDESDADTSDEICDVDLQMQGDQCSLRAAIELANQLGGAEITFDIPGTGIPVIAPEETLPTIMSPTTIDGTTQPGAVVHIVGTNAGESNGLTISGTSDVDISGLSITSFSNWGLRFDGGTGHRVVKSSVGFPPGDDSDPAENTLGSILVENGAAGVTIGGESDDDENRLYGRIHILGASTNRVKILRNEMAVDFVDAGESRVPIDLAEDGPTCSPWDPGAAAGPNNNMPAPRLLAISSSTVSGITRPRSQVVIFTTRNAIVGHGTEKGRYWPAWVIPVGYGEADDMGEFSISLDEILSDGSRVTALAVDSEGNTSELSQLMRPVIYVPGIGGSWLKGANGDNIWIPLGTGGSTDANDRLARMEMNPSGESIENLVVDGILELGGHAVYGPAIGSIVDAGFVDSESEALRDLWRFPYDWRTNTSDRALELMALVNHITSGSDGVARSCEVDIVAHSNGNLVSSIYIRSEAEHARNHVHRYVAVAAPYLGAGKAAAAHATGYVFDIEKELHFVAEWGRMITMARNMTGAYGLMPSRKYWEAVDLTSPSHKHGFLFQDLYGNPLRSYDATAKFLSDPKTDVDGYPRGLDRNGPLYASQEIDVHTHIDDWTDWNGPPQVFRQAGALHASTVTGWVQGGWIVESQVETFEHPRYEPGDTHLHDEWRQRTQPILGWGDETVPLVSATLGADNRVSAKDFSGEDSPWIEPVQLYACNHTGIIVDSCIDRFGGSVSALEEVQKMLTSGHRVIADESAAQKTTRANKVEDGAELFYISASGPVAVSVVDSLGNLTGPVSLEEYRVVDYSATGTSFYPSETGAVLTLQNGNSYSLSIQSPVEDIVVRVFRMLVDEQDESRMTILFPDQAISVNGKLELDIEAEGTATDTSFLVDADGDGAFEGTLDPVEELTGDVGYPAIPMPDRSIISVKTDGTAPVRAYIDLPDVGATGWTWALDEDATWILPVATSGNAPATIELDLAADMITDTLTTSSVLVQLSYGAYVIDVTIPVELRIGSFTVDTEPDDIIIPAEFEVSAAYPNPFRDRVTFEISLPNEDGIKIDVFDMLGRHVRSVNHNVMVAGKHRVVVDGGGLSTGVYLVRVVRNNEAITRAFTKL